MPPAAANEIGGKSWGPLHTVLRTAFPRPRQRDCVPLHPLEKGVSFFRDLVVEAVSYVHVVLSRPLDVLFFTALRHPIRRNVQ